MHQAKQVRAETFIRKELLSILILGAIASFAACQSSSGAAPASQIQSTVPDTPEADRERLLSRVKEYWQARIQHDTKATFQYEHPVRRKQLGEQAYLTGMKPNITIREFSILNVENVELAPQADDASIQLQLKYEYTFPQPGAKSMLVPTQVTDYWEKDQGIWYHVLDTDVIAKGRPVISRQQTPQRQNEEQNAPPSSRKTD
jgi:hypothetical protein